MPLGNLIMRGTGALLAMIAVVWLQPPLGLLGASAPDQTRPRPHRLQPAAGAGRHAARRPRLPACRAHDRDEGAADADEQLAADRTVGAVDESALDTPSQALANATREVVRVCETVEIMLKRIMELYEEADDDKIKALAASTTASTASMRRSSSTSPR